MSQKHTSDHSTSEKLLRAMTRQLEQDRDEERERLAELEARGAGDEESRRALEAFRPLGADFRHRVMEALAEQRATEESAATAGKDDAPGTKVLPFRRVRHWIGGERMGGERIGGERMGGSWRGRGIAAAALAASLIFFFLPGADVTPLADYDLVLAPGLQTERSAPTAPVDEPVFVPGMEMELVLRPSTRLEGEIETRLFVESENGDLQPFVAPRIERAESGAFRIGATVGVDLDLAPGRYTLHVLVGRPGALPGGDPRGKAAAGEGWRYLRGRLRIGQNP